MLIPIDRPMIDARNIRPAATQTVSGDDVADPALVHDNRATLRVTLTGTSQTHTQGPSVQAIQSGVCVGQQLRIMVVDDGSDNYLEIVDDTATAKTVLRGNWKSSRAESATAGYSYLDLEWDGTYWVEIERYDGINWSSSGRGAHAEGFGTVASGDFSHAEGESTTASSYYTHAEGSSTEANGIATHAQGEASKATLYGEHAQASGKFSGDVRGSAQRSVVTFRGSTTDETLTEIFLDGNDDRLTILDEYTYACKVMVVGRQNDGTDHFMGSYHVLIERTGGAVALVGAVDVIYENNAGGLGAGGGLPVELTAANNALTLKVEGLAVHNVRWVGTVEMIRVGYAD